MLSFAKMTLYYYFLIKSISKSKMDIFILSNLEILKKVLKKMCNLHIVTETYIKRIQMGLEGVKRLINLSLSIKGFFYMLMCVNILLKMMCNLHIVTETYFRFILNIPRDDKRSCQFIYLVKSFIVICDSCSHWHIQTHF